MKCCTCLILSMTLLVFFSCDFPTQKNGNTIHDSTKLESSGSFAAKVDTPGRDSVLLIVDTVKTDSVLVPASQVHTKNVHPQQVVEFAKTLIGTPYRYASTDPKVGFDCSGFITYVFTHFKIIVPRSSIDFTNVGKEISWQDSKPGDLILFTGTDSTEKFVGHMGLIVTNNNQQLEFIHSTSGKKYGVTITPLNSYYMSRYMKTIRVFPEND